jgi:NodT family efflux transporter outer membrane factor (OMF) lipoprotein
VGTSVSYDLDLFGGARRRRESLADDTEAQARELDAAYLSLTGQVVRQALIIADASIQSASLQDIVEHDQTALTMVRQSLEAGGSSAVDVVDAEAQIAQDAAALPAQRQRLAAARHAMAVLVGKAPSEWSPPPFDAESGVLPAVLPVSVPSAFVHDRPDILEAEARLHAATAQIGVAQAARYPDVTLNGAYNLDSLTTGALFSPISTSWAAGAGVTAPLFHSGELRARQREAEAAARAALADYQQTVLEAFAQVADVLQAIAHDNQVYAEQTRALKAAAARLDAVRDSYRLGGVTALQVVDAERTWRRASLGLSQTASSRHADAAMLLLAVATVPPGLAAQTQSK